MTFRNLLNTPALIVRSNASSTANLVGRKYTSTYIYRFAYPDVIHNFTLWLSLILNPKLQFTIFICLATFMQHSDILNEGKLKKQFYLIPQPGATTTGLLSTSYRNTKINLLSYNLFVFVTLVYKFLSFYKKKTESRGMFHVEFKYTFKFFPSGRTLLLYLFKIV